MYRNNQLRWGHRGPASQHAQRQWARPDGHTEKPQKNGDDRPQRSHCESRCDNHDTVDDSGNTAGSPNDNSRGVNAARGSYDGPGKKEDLVAVKDGDQNKNIVTRELVAASTVGNATQAVDTKNCINVWDMDSSAAAHAAKAPPPPLHQARRLSQSGQSSQHGSGRPTDRAHRDAREVVGEHVTRRSGNGGRQTCDVRLAPSSRHPASTATAAKAATAPASESASASGGDGGVPIDEGDAARYAALQAKKSRRVAQWVRTVKHTTQDAGYAAANGAAMTTTAASSAPAWDASTECSADRCRLPTLLDDPAHNNNHLPAMEPTGLLYRLRMEILENFAARCREARHGVAADAPPADPRERPSPRQPPPPPSSAPSSSPRSAPPSSPPPPLCVHCAPASTFTMRPHHARLFLDSVLLPLSTLVSYADMVGYVNTAVIERVFADAGLGNARSTDPSAAWADIVARPVYEDFRGALVLATHRRRVLEELPVVLDACGMVARREDERKA
ncbi:hypothetical protein SPI_06017 [Niveomyces insectorum RCEF 264]|uniref:Restriction of telomere capping protein 4 n=1 Tax=Niveomyces insectorum RCEF 264 TaxID=1081102 RepID=A0A167SQ02_9HYPO|nr:hypothetical protein SPI_06017 [Niveomyces insectorum RCEF 264]